MRSIKEFCSILLLFLIVQVHLSDERFYFDEQSWQIETNNIPENNADVHNSNPNKFSPVILSKCNALIYHLEIDLFLYIFIIEKTS